MVVPAAPRTIGDAVAIALRKELLHLWASADPASLSAAATDAVVKALAPALAESLLTAARRRLPGLAARADSPLPAAPARPGGGAGDRGAVEREELLEELQGLLGSHDLLASLDERAREHMRWDVDEQVPAAHPWQTWLSGGCPMLLPAESALSLCTVVAPALLAGHGEGGGEGGRAGVWAAEGPEDGAAASAETPRGLAPSLRCRRRVFALERELGARERAGQEREAFERDARRKSEARLMEVNQQLEERLRARTEEARQAAKKAAEAQRGFHDARAQLNEKRKEATQLKYKLEQCLAVRKESEAREQEHSRAVLRSAARESSMREATKQHAEQLQRCLDGQAVADLLCACGANSDKPHTILDQIEAELQERFKRRKEQYEAAYSNFKQRVETKRTEYDLVLRKA